MNTKTSGAIVRAFMIAMLAAAISLLSACGKSSNGAVTGKVNVVTSFYPLYFLANEIGGEDAHVVNLIPAGVEPHDWTPKSRDLITVGDAQLFLYNGAGLEGWLDDFLHGLDSSGKTLTVEASKGIALIQGNPEEENHEEEHEAHGDSDVDPHTWVSPKSALVMAKNVLDAFIQADAVHRSGYEERYASLEAKLAKLDDQFETGLSALPNKNIVVSHQAFGYLARDYGLNQVAIMGLSPEAEPRSQDLLKVVEFVKEHKVKVIFFEELVSDRLAKTLASEAKVETMVLNPLEGLTPQQEKAGDDFITIMERNLQNLRQALQ
ncbi:metal ABC transporter solute-binding protein, Zn/Mn family [Cohnella faecalis]|nr:zinc ABC transporter substrate-binding protein [Cohnella faecalis]